MHGNTFRAVETMEVLAILTKKRNFSKFYTKGYNLIETNNTNTFFFNRHFCTSNFIPWTSILEKNKNKITNEIQTLFFILTVISFFHSESAIYMPLCQLV